LYGITLGDGKRQIYNEQWQSWGQFSHFRCDTQTSKAARQICPFVIKSIHRGGGDHRYAVAFFVGLTCRNHRVKSALKNSSGALETLRWGHQVIPKRRKQNAHWCGVIFQKNVIIRIIKLVESCWGTNNFTFAHFTEVRTRVRVQLIRQKLSKDKLNSNWNSIILSTTTTTTATTIISCVHANTPHVQTGKLLTNKNYSILVLINIKTCTY